MISQRERGRTPEKVAVLPATPTPCHLTTIRRTACSRRIWSSNLAYQVHEGRRVLLADESRSNQDVIALEDQVVLVPGATSASSFMADMCPMTSSKSYSLQKSATAWVYQRVGDIGLQRGKDVLADELDLVTPDTLLYQADTGIKKLGIDPLRGGTGFFHNLDRVVEVAHPGECIGDLPVELGPPS